MSDDQQREAAREAWRDAGLPLGVFATARDVAAFMAREDGGNECAYLAAMTRALAIERQRVELGMPRELSSVEVMAAGTRLLQSRVHTLKTALGAAVEVIGLWLKKPVAGVGGYYTRIGTGDEVDKARDLLATLERVLKSD